MGRVLALYAGGSGFDPLAKLDFYSFFPITFGEKLRGHIVCECICNT